MLNIKTWLGLVPYVSEIDQFLRQFRKTHPQLTDAQQKEKEKYSNISRLRDKSQTASGVKTETIWNNF